MYQYTCMLVYQYTQLRVDYIITTRANCELKFLSSDYAISRREECNYVYYDVHYVLSVFHLKLRQP